MKKLDEIDYKILEVLKKDSRMSYADISREVNLSRVAVRDRVLRLQAEGIIEEFTIVINRQALGKTIAVFFDIEVEPYAVEDVAAELSRQDQVAIVYQMTGSTSLHVHAFLEGTVDLDKFMKEHIYAISGIRNINSYILLKQYKSDLSLR